MSERRPKTDTWTAKKLADFLHGHGDGRSRDFVMDGADAGRAIYEVLNAKSEAQDRIAELEAEVARLRLQGETDTRVQWARAEAAEAKLRRVLAKMRAVRETCKGWAGDSFPKNWMGGILLDVLDKDPPPCPDCKALREERDEARENEATSDRQADAMRDEWQKAEAREKALRERVEAVLATSACILMAEHPEVTCSLRVGLEHVLRRQEA